MKTINNQIITDIKSLLKASTKITIISHYAPDGDAVGSSTALYQIFKKEKFDVSMVVPSDISKNLEKIPFSNEIVSFSKKPNKVKELLQNADIIFCTDFNAFSRVGDVSEILSSSPAKKIMLDHHPQPEDCADFVISDPGVSSASEIVYEFILLMGYEQLIDKDVATSIYTGLMTDTINFTVNSEKQRTFEIASKLLSYKIDKKGIYNNIFNNYSIDRMRFSGYVLYEKMKFIENKNTAYIIISKEELDKFNFKSGDHDGFVNMPLSIKDIETSILVIEHEKYLKISLRSKTNYDVNALSRKYFNGGGHKNASGGRLYINLEEVESYIIDAINNFE